MRSPSSPATGTALSIIGPRSDAYVVNVFLAEFSSESARDALAVPIQDGAGFNIKGSLSVPGKESLWHFGRSQHSLNLRDDDRELTRDAAATGRVAAGVESEWLRTFFAMLTSAAPRR